MMEVESTVLDLCTKKRTPSPVQYKHNKTDTTRIIYDSPTGQYSPVSNHSDSEASSTVSDKIHLYALPLPSPKLKATRPFKAYPKDPLNVAALGVASVGRDSVDAFTEFRQRVLSQVQSNNNGTNKNMRRITPSSQGRNDDPTYWEKRRKNNEAAKRSRDARRAKEDEIAIRCAFLEQENLQLKFRIATLEQERQRLQDLLYHHT